MRFGTLAPAAERDRKVVATAGGAGTSKAVCHEGCATRKIDAEPTGGLPGEHVIGSLTFEQAAVLFGSYFNGEL